MNIKEKVYSALSMPLEAAGTTKITIEGSSRILIENYKGLQEYEEDHIRIKTSCQNLTIEGECFQIKTLTDDDILIEGKITGVSMC